MESFGPGSGGSVSDSSDKSLINPAPLGLDAIVQTGPRLHLYVFSGSLCSQEF